MLHNWEIWDCLKKNLPTNSWVSLDEIYKIIENNLTLDSDDFEPEASHSSVPKWKRNVRNVLQYRKRKSQILWDGDSRYKMSN